MLLVKHIYAQGNLVTVAETDLPQNLVTDTYVLRSQEFNHALHNFSIWEE